MLGYNLRTSFNQSSQGGTRDEDNDRWLRDPPQIEGDHESRLPDEIPSESPTCACLESDNYFTGCPTPRRLDLSAYYSTMTLDKESWSSPERLLAKFDANNDGLIDFEEFKSMCLELFGPEELEKLEYRVRDIFEIFDVDEDGMLNQEEWERCCNDWTRVVANPVNVLLVVDVQNDFIDGTLALRDCGKGEDGVEVVEPINRLLTEVRWDKVVYSLDWHPETHLGFYENLGLRELHPDSKIGKEEAKPFDTVVFLDPHLEQRLWPRHCVIESWGAQLHKDLIIVPESEQVRKGQNPDMEAYSVFADNNRENSRELLDILEGVGATDLYVCGLAYDVCVRYTCEDGLRLGYRLAVVEDCCRGVDPVDVRTTRKYIEENGGFLTNSEAVPALVAGERRSLAMAFQQARSLDKKIAVNPAAE